MAAKKKGIHRGGGRVMVQKHPQESTDIRAMSAKYLKPQPVGRRPTFGDFTSMDFLEAQNRMVKAEQDFMALPSKIRKKMGNSPYQALRYVEDPENAPQLREWGVLPPLPPETPPEATKGEEKA